MKHLRTIAVLGCLSLMMGPVAEASSWQPLGAQSSLGFVATYEGDPAPGVFHVFRAALNFDPGRPTKGNLQVRVDLASADMRSADINAAIHGPLWLASASRRWAEFDSSDIRRSGPHRYVATGVLTLKGHRGTIAVPFSWTLQGDEAVLEGMTSVDRTVFDVGSGEWARPDQIGVHITLHYRVAFRRGP